MKHSSTLLAAALGPALVAAAPGRQQRSAKTPVNDDNANYIFNSVIDGMRQFGESLHHNGMTIFPAYVPEGTEFYHGTSSAYRINGTQWLAFEPEHALGFARPRGGHHGGGPGGHFGGPGGGNSDDDKNKPSSPGQSDDDDDDRKPPGPPGDTPHGPPQDGDDDEDKRPGPPGHHDGHDGPHWGPPRGDDDEDDKPHWGPPRDHDEDDDHPHRGPPRDGDEEDDKPHRGPPRDHDDDEDDQPHRGPPRDEHDVASSRGFSGFARRSLARLQDIFSIADAEKLSQQPIISKTTAVQDDDKEEETAGYLHTYRTKRALRLLYADGQSAAKSTKGTLDMQDLVLRDPKDGGPLPPRMPGSGPGNGPMSEGERAREICQKAKDEWYGEWTGEIDGILRMEAGFEIILCSFEDALDVVSIQQVSGGGRAGGGFDMYLSAIAARYDDIGDNRVTLDWENMVSLFTFDDLVYIDDDSLPRVDNTSSQLSAARSAIARAATSTPSETAHNWQATADMIVTRYSDKLQYLATAGHDSLDAFRSYITTILRPYTDYAHPSPEAEIHRCAAQFWPAGLPDVDKDSVELSVPAAAVRRVAQKICSTLVEARDARTLDHAQGMIQNLTKWLDWVNFKRCRGCQLGEFCVVPVWPFGSKEDYEHPSCKTGFGGGPGGGGESYWGGMGGPGHGGPPPSGGKSVPEVDAVRSWRAD